MKKLLSILGVIGLTTTSTATVIACGNPNKNDIPEIIIEKEQIIKDFKDEVTSIIIEHEKNIQPKKSIRDTTNKDYKFFEENVLKKLLDGNEEVKKDLEKQELMDFNNDFNDIMDVNSVKKEINKLAENEYYAVILSNLPNEKEVFEKIATPTTIEIRGNEGAVTQVENFYANVNFKYSYKINYLKNEGSLETFEHFEDFVFSFTTNKKFYDAIEKMQKEIKHDFFKESKDFSYVSSEKLKYKNKAELEIKEDDVLDFYNDRGKGFSSEFEEIANKNYFPSSIPDNPKIDFSKEGNIVKNLKWNVKYRNPSNDEISPSSYEYKPINLKEFEENANTNLSQVLNLLYKYNMSEENSFEKVLALNEFKDEDNSQYNQLEEKFTKEVNEFYKSNDLEGVNDKDKDIKITQIGTMQVHNVVAKIGKNYEHQIPGPFNLITSYLPSEEFTRVSLEVKRIIAKNIAIAIEAFQESYGIYHGRKILLPPVFGVFKTKSKVYELWGDWNDGNQDTNLESAYKQINLTATTQLMDIRKELLFNSKQSNFNYSFVGKGKEKYLIEKNLAYLTIEEGRSQNYNFFFEIDYFKIIINYNFGPKENHIRLFTKDAR